ncbi:MAG: carbohydrate kinase family protein [Burkholderiaceae bacterium]|nr:carbohydrate kinase family protein [Burkholderiaceae bacterium]
MTARVLISGSIAYDTIMVFEGRFADHILPERVHMLNVSFLTPRLKREFGGCAANIAFNLRGLGGEPVVLATVGQDAGEYLARLDALGISTTHVMRLDTHYTSQCFITTDLADNQITAFHPGAMSESHRVSALDAAPAVLAIIAPNGKQAMLRHAAQFRDAGVPFVFDPGQGLPMFDSSELRALVASARAVAVNDYESQVLAQRTGWSESEIAAQVPAFIVTRGGEGSRVWEAGKPSDIAACPIARAVDPTGCGDAYRAGLLYGVANGWDWVKAARLGSVMGAIKIESQGAQNHRLERESIAERFAAAYGERPW